MYFSPLSFQFNMHKKLHPPLALLLVVFNVPSTARSFRDGTPIYCPLRRTWSSINTPFRPGIEPRAVAWQSITLPLRYASFSSASQLSWRSPATHSVDFLYFKHIIWLDAQTSYAPNHRSAFKTSSVKHDAGFVVHCCLIKHI